MLAVLLLVVSEPTLAAAPARLLGAWEGVTSPPDAELRSQLRAAHLGPYHGAWVGTFSPSRPGSEVCVTVDDPQAGVWVQADPGLVAVNGRGRARTAAALGEVQVLVTT